MVRVVMIEKRGMELTTKVLQTVEDHLNHLFYDGVEDEPKTLVTSLALPYKATVHEFAIDADVNMWGRVILCRSLVDKWPEWGWSVHG